MYNDNIKPMFYCIYEELLRQAKSKDTNSILYKHHVNYIKDANRYSNYFGKKEFIDNYLSQDPNEIVVDFIASMTDDYFIDLYEYLFPDGPVSYTHLMLTILYILESSKNREYWNSRLKN